MINQELLSRLKSVQLVFVVGPTAVGKSAWGFKLAQELKAEIVSCDAMQVYQEINIASAKPSVQERKKIKHHCLDLVSVTEDFNVAQFRVQAVKAIDDILAKGKQAVIIGGSGMYVSVLLDGIFEHSAKDPALREQLELQARDQGLDSLYQQLKGLDPQAADKIHAHDAKRIVRALEVSLSKGKAFSTLKKQRQGIWGKYKIVIIGLNRDRQELYQRVDQRVEAMFNEGLVKEIEEISQRPLSSTARPLIGVPEVQGYLRKEYDLERAKYLMKLHTRHYVKRQLTWFRRDERIEWIRL